MNMNLFIALILLCWVRDVKNSVDCPTTIETGVEYINDDC